MNQRRENKEANIEKNMKDGLYEIKTMNKNLKIAHKIRK